MERIFRVSLFGHQTLFRTKWTRNCPLQNRYSQSFSPTDTDCTSRYLFSVRVVWQELACLGTREVGARLIKSIFRLPISSLYRGRAKRYHLVCRALTRCTFKFFKNIGISMKSLRKSDHKSFNIDASLHLLRKTKLAELGSESF